MNKHEIKTKQRNKLFYEHYKYSINFNLKEGNALRLISNDLESSLHRINSDIALRKFYNKSWLAGHISERTVENLKAVAHFLVLNDREYKLVTGRDWVYLYVNDPSFFDDLANMSFISKLWIQEAVITHSKDTILLKTNSYKHRSYFKVLYSKDPDVGKLYSWLQKQPEVKMCPSLEHKAFSGFWEHHFIDYNDPRLPVMMGLIRPNALRKTYNICQNSD